MVPFGRLRLTLRSHWLGTVCQLVPRCLAAWIKKHTRLDRVQREQVVVAISTILPQYQPRPFPVDAVFAHRESEVLLLLRVIAAMKQPCRPTVIHNAAVEDKPQSLSRPLRLQDPLDPQRRIQHSRDASGQV